MSMPRKWILNGNLILPDKVQHGGHLVIEDDEITGIYRDGLRPEFQENDEIIDASGLYVMPGMIDIHSDAIEKEIQPRPGALFPVEMCFRELERKLAVAGITSMYHSFSLTGGVDMRSNDKVVEMVRFIQKYRRKRVMIRHMIHLRYEVVNIEGIDIVEDLLERNVIDLLSYMDHTPGQGQYTELSKYKNYVSQTYNKGESDINDIVNDRLERQKKVDWPRLKKIAIRAMEKNITLASHDDDSKDKINQNVEQGMTICEFPVNMSTAYYAREKNMDVSVGAPNIVRGKSHTNNLKAIDAIREGAANMICSDYLPSSMLTAVFKIYDMGMNLSQAVAMVTSTPAKAVGIDDRLGSIEKGKQADLLLIEMFEDSPVVRSTIVAGQEIIKSHYHQPVQGHEWNVKKNPGNYHVI